MINPAREIRMDLEAIGSNASLNEESGFAGRSEAIDYLEFHVLDRIEGLLQTMDPPADLIPLKRHAESIKRRLEDIDEKMFRRIREEIRAGAALKDLLAKYAPTDAILARHEGGIGYDALDAFVNGLLLARPAPLETKAREAEMVYYQKTPARIVFELVEKAHFRGEDVFYDLGSGLGQVSLLVNMLSGVKANGIEFEPAYCEYANACALDLNLSRVGFKRADARNADFADGTVFFMYTPFEGRILQDVLERLREEARGRTIRLFTYGPCTSPVSAQSWLERIDGNGDHPYKLGMFTSL